jgi:hypothetical protein
MPATASAIEAPTEAATLIAREAPRQGAATPEALGPAGYTSFWDLALGVNRSNPEALALASDGETSHIAIDPDELKKLLGTVWFRSVFPRLSSHWRERVFDVLVDTSHIPNHLLRVGRRDVHLSDLRHAEVKEVFSRSSIPEDVRADVRLVMTVGNLWGAESLARLRYTEVPESRAGSSIASRFLGML